MKTLSFAIAISALFFLLSGSGYAGPAYPMDASSGDHTFEIEASGLKRCYVVHVPANYNGTAPVPVVVMFHGGGGSASNAMAETGWSAKAEKECFLAVYPEGTRPDTSKTASFRKNPQTWNDGSGRSILRAARKNVDDIGFVNAFLDDLSARYKVDQTRIYLAGFSNGASMAFRAGRGLSMRIAAIAPVAGADWLDTPMPAHPVPLLYITGTKDPLNPIEGGSIRLGRLPAGNKPPDREMVRKWASMIGCPTEPKTVRDNDGVKGIIYGPSKDGSEVVFYTVEGMGHAWPGGVSLMPESMVGKTSDKLNATDLIWEFFQRHQRK